MEGCPCPWQGFGTRWSLRSLPIQTILRFYGCSPTFCSQQGQLHGQTRLLRAVSSLVWKHPSTEMAQPPWTASTTPPLPHGEKVPPYSHSEPLLLQLVSVVSCPDIMWHCEEPGSDPSVGTEGCCEVLPLLQG